MVEAKPGCLIGGRLVAIRRKIWPLDLNPIHLEYR